MRAIEPKPSTIARVLLSSAEPKAIARGPELLVECNDAFVAVLGLNPPDTNSPLRDVCAPLWARLEPLAEAALLRAESAVLDDQLICRFRSGFSEEAYVRCACGPLLDENDAVVGVIISLTETTEQVLAVRRTAALRDIAAAAASAQSVIDACRESLTALARHRSDLPFALMYLCGAEAGVVYQAAPVELPNGRPPNPNAIDLSAVARAVRHAVAAAMAANTVLVIDDVVERFGALPSGDWPFAPRCAVIAPITSPGELAPDGALVAGISARHEFDAEYRAFLELVVKQIGAAIAGGRAHEARERQTQARAVARGARAKRREHIRAMKARFAGVLDERTRLAREIHDTLLQGVTGVALQLRAVLPHLETASTTAVSRLANIVELAEKTGRDARQAVWDLRPVDLGEHDLSESLEVAARRLTIGTEIKVHVSVSGTVRPLPAEYETAVVRVVQEAVSNAVRHAAPSEIRLRVGFGARRLRVAVHDDGRGFAVHDDFKSYAGHWGLLGMRERATRLGGAIVVESTPSRGASVTLLLPYAHAVRERAPVVDPDNATLLQPPAHLMVSAR